jgi:hypothetical protein
MEARTCKDCGQKLTIDHFYSKGGGYLDIRCKKCANKKRHQWRMSNPDAHERDKATSRRYHEKHREASIEKRRQKYIENIETHRARDRERYHYGGKKEYSREWRRRNPERSKEMRRRSYFRHAEKRRAEKRIAYAKDPGLYRERRRRQWQKNNSYRFRCLFISRRYKHRIRHLPNTLTIEQWQRALDYFHGYCAVCERPLKDLFGTHTAAQDHWIPVTSPNCPGTIATNTVPLCHGEGGCNNSKLNIPAEEWLTRKFGATKAAKIIARIEAYFKWVREQDAE